MMCCMVGGPPWIVKILWYRRAHPRLYGSKNKRYMRSFHCVALCYGLVWCDIAAATTGVWITSLGNQLDADVVGSYDTHSNT